MTLTLPSEGVHTLAGPRIDLEAVTALFLHGADPREQAELRAPALKGVARYWFRAALGAGAGPSCPGGACGACVRCLEGAVFGSTARKGASLTVATAEGPLRTGKSALLPHHTDRGRGDERTPSICILPGTRFSATWYLGLPPAGGPSRSAILGSAGAATWLAATLGGLGQRARRGAGSLRVASTHWSRGVLPACQPQPCDVAGLARHLEEGIRQACDTICGLTGGRAGWLAGAAPGLRPGVFPALIPGNPDFARVVLAPIPARGEEEARKFLMLSLRRFKDPAFGLPYMKTPQGREHEKMNGRHASPLWLRLVLLEGQPASGRFALLATKLWSETVKGKRGELDRYLDTVLLSENRGSEITL